MTFADSHAHLSLVAEESGADALRDIMDAFAAAWAEAAARGRPGPIIVDPGVDPSDLAARRLLVGDRPFLRMAAGIWPSADALADPAVAMASLEASIAQAAAEGHPCAAVGECGLDYHHMNGPRERQMELFAAQIALADRLGLPLIVHSREAFADTLATLAAAKLSTAVVIHCFGYGPAEARAFLDIGCYISFAGNLTYKKAEALRDACALTPADRLLLETDSPYMCPEPRRGRPSTPLDVGRSYARAAAVRGEDVEALAGSVSANVAELFG